MDPNPPRAPNIKHVASRKRKASRIPQLLTRPRTGSTSVPQQLPLIRKDLQAQRYNLFQRSKYTYGRQIDWNAYVHANFYTEVKKYIDDMGWMGLANLSKKNFSTVCKWVLFRYMLSASEYDNPARFRNDIYIHSLTDKKELLLSQLLGIY